jgi:hypothetical protein
LSGLGFVDSHKGFGQAFVLMLASNLSQPVVEFFVAAIKLLPIMVPS